ncbi:Bifunctional inhibitor/plant lipid transfer protein/seed storage helical domain-containing protein [Cynara cardunculus var. scolymus]|uniref:Bifunctional inhibitor/plant lipid transfer protein/seed storage helical domain-containing protein n=1 Tax=Cynara cardunculus var. scolymus TaxID=59895 RepID=A0A118JUA6_CYNCS|nr:Bifunctional inhibitor/plant lipid transfer protein/seed storage helical domain-containing protein [Cynara cardunculus var. scolymus]
MKTSCAFLAMMVVAATILTMEVRVGMAADCEVLKLTSCLPAFTGGPIPAPDSPCCQNLRSQQDCFCDYMKDPAYNKFLSMPAAKQVAQACSVTIPSPSTC